MQHRKRGPIRVSQLLAKPYKVICEQTRIKVFLEQCWWTKLSTFSYKSIVRKNMTMKVIFAPHFPQEGSATNKTCQCTPCKRTYSSGKLHSQIKEVNHVTAWREPLWISVSHCKYWSVFAESHCKNTHTSMRWTLNTINYSNPYQANKRPRLQTIKRPNPTSES